VFLAELDAADGGDGPQEVGGGVDNKNNNKKNSKTKGTESKAGTQGSQKDNLVGQASDSSVYKSESENAGGESLTDLKAALESDKKLSSAEISTAKKTIMGFRSAAALLFKQADDLQKLL